VAAHRHVGGLLLRPLLLEWAGRAPAAAAAAAAGPAASGSCHHRQARARTPVGRQPLLLLAWGLHDLAKQKQGPLLSMREYTKCCLHASLKLYQ